MSKIYTGDRTRPIWLGNPKIPLSENAEIRKKVSIIKVKVLLQQDIFFGTMLSSVNIWLREGVRTSATNGVEIFLDPEHWSTLSIEDGIKELIHEIYHIVYLHCEPSRMKHRVQEVWAIAGDFVINKEIRDSFRGLPAGWLYDSKFDGMSTELVYSKLMETAKKQLTPNCGGLEAAPSEQAAADTKNKIMAAAALSNKSKGSIPAGVQALLDKLKEGTVPWKRILKTWLFDGVGKGYDLYCFHRPEKRYVSFDVFVPTMVGIKAKGNIVWGIDTSGSISKEELQRFGGELYNLLTNIPDLNLHVMTCDAAVHEVVNIKNPGDILKRIKFLGRGGTSFVPVFDKVEELKLKPSGLIYMTDLMGDFPPKKPKYPVLWVSTSPEGLRPPWGDYLQLRIESEPPT